MAMKLAYQLHPQIIYFGKYLKEKGSSSNTIQKHQNNLKFVLSKIKGFDKKSFNGFIVESKKNNLSEDYLNGYIFSVRLFSRYLKEKGYNAEEELENYPQFKSNRDIKTGSLSREEVDAILNVVPTRKHKFETNDDEKWRAFFSIMAYTGLFPGEVAQLTKSSINLKERIITTQTNPIIQPRQVPIPEDIMPAVRFTYQNAPDSGLLFSRKTNKNKPERTVNWHFNFKRRLSSLGMSDLDTEARRITVMSLRVFYIEEVLRQGMDFMMTKKIAGHSDIRSTNNYAKRVTLEGKKMKKAVDKIFS